MIELLAVWVILPGTAVFTGSLNPVPTFKILTLQRSFLEDVQTTAHKPWKVNLHERPRVEFAARWQTTLWHAFDWQSLRGVPFNHCDLPHMSVASWKGHPCCTESSDFMNAWLRDAAKQARVLRAHSVMEVNQGEGLLDAIPHKGKK